MNSKQREVHTCWMQSSTSNNLFQLPGILEHLFANRQGRQFFLGGLGGVREHVENFVVVQLPFSLKKGHIISASNLHFLFVRVTHLVAVSNHVIYTFEKKHPRSFLKCKPVVRRLNTRRNFVPAKQTKKAMPTQPPMQWLIRSDGANFKRWVQDPWSSDLKWAFINLYRH